MPRLCISLLALFFLPQSLSCQSRPPEEVRNDYMAIVQTDLDNTRGSVTDSLHNSSCKEPEDLHNCSGAQAVEVVHTLHKLACRMKRLKLPQTKDLAVAIVNSISCVCHEERTKDHSAKKPRTAPKSNEERRSKRTNKLCKARAMLSGMTECYQILNVRLADT